MRLARKPEKKVLTANDVAEYLGISAPSARKFLANGTIPGGFRVGRLYRITRESFDQYLRLTRSEK